MLYIPIVGVHLPMFGTWGLNNTTKQLDLYTMLHSTTAEYTIFSSTYGKFTK